TPLQIHRWFGQFEYQPPSTKKDSTPPTTFLQVGDWVIGERVFASRGEYVGLNKVPAHVPYWSAEQSQFTLAGRPVRGSKDTRPVAEVRFIDQAKAPLLVDFEGGTMTYKHGAAPTPKNDDGSAADEETKPKPTTTEPEGVKSDSATEVLLLTPD